RERGRGAVGVPRGRQVRGRGRARAAEFRRDVWCERLGAALPAAPARATDRPGDTLEVRRRTAERTAGVGDGVLLVPVEVWNWGAAPAPAEGPARVELCARVYEEASEDLAGPVDRTSLPRLVTPGDKVAAAVAVTVPEKPGTYRVVLWAQASSSPLSAVLEGGKDGTYGTHGDYTSYSHSS